MDKIKDFFTKRSIKKSFTVYMLACIVAGLGLSLAFSNLCQWGQRLIYNKYELDYEETGSQVEIGFPQNSDQPENAATSDHTGILRYYTKDATSLFTPIEKHIYDLLGGLSLAVYPLCFILCMGMSSILFYKRQLQPPLELLDQAAQHIAENNLDFQIVYEKQDELGKLFQSFEKMREALLENNQEMWRLVEERRRLNAAFAHDLRTPLTVLKGQSEMLMNYASLMPPKKITATAGMMKRHIIRLESYVNTMTDLQRLEDIEVKRQSISGQDAADQLRSMGDSICQNKKFLFSGSSLKDHSLLADFAVIMQVYENLLSNACRFAEETIWVQVLVKEGALYLTVSDDGQGFSSKDLANALNPFYKSSGETGGEHFGMGLYICKVLCEKHGGYLRLANKPQTTAEAVFML